MYFLTAVTSACLSLPLVQYRLRCPHLPAQRRCKRQHEPSSSCILLVVGAHGALLGRRQQVSNCCGEVTLWEARRSPPPRRHRVGFSQENHYLANHWPSFFMNKHLTAARSRSLCWASFSARKKFRRSLGQSTKNKVR